MKNQTRSALLVIDIEQGFLSKESAYCIRGAAATVPACERAEVDSGVFCQAYLPAGWQRCGIYPLSSLEHTAPGNQSL